MRNANAHMNSNGIKVAKEGSFTGPTCQVKMESISRFWAK